MSPDLAIHYAAFALPKRGNSADEYEDAYRGDPLRGRFAIADGASESSFAAEWARLLVDAFVDSAVAQPAPWLSWLPAIQQRWQTALLGRELPWYAQAKVDQGAFAAFLGVVLETQQSLGRTQQLWQAVAVGDSCFFQVRAGQMREAFPIKRACDFGNSPWLLGSRGSVDSNVEKRAVRSQGDWVAGDRFWLMTDALAQWFLEEVEAGRKPWEALEPLLTDPQPQERFVGLVEGLRDAHALRNDDVTLEAVGL